jgi:amidohydrolase
METKKLQSVLVEHFQHLHRNPELSLREVKTTAYIRGILENAGIEILDTGLKTGCIAVVRGEKSGRNSKIVALRADIDALPINEETNLPYKSEIPGCMHACGHDFHTTSLLGAALLLAERKKELAGTVKLLFQPAEEQSFGAEKVVSTGFLDDVQEIYGMHVGPDDKIESGKIAISPGGTFAAAIAFKINFQGKGGHGALPHLCKDPVLAQAMLISGAQSIVSRNINAQDCAVLSFTHVESGSAWNITPDTAFVEGTIRSLNTEKAVFAAERLSEMCAGIQLATGVGIKFDYHLDTPATNNDPLLCEFARKTAEELGFSVEPFNPTMAAEDFSIYQQKIRGVFIGFSVKSPAGLHNPGFIADSSCLHRAAALMAELAFKSCAAAS